MIMERCRALEAKDLKILNWKNWNEYAVGGGWWPELAIKK